MRNIMKNKGFTLIELLVVIAIIGILAAIIMVSLGSARAKAKDARVQSDVRSLMSAVELYINDHDAVPTMTLLIGDKLISKEPTDASGGKYIITDCTSGSYIIVPDNPLLTGAANNKEHYFYAKDGATGVSTTAKPTKPTCAAQ